MSAPTSVDPWAGLYSDDEAASVEAVRDRIADDLEALLRTSARVVVVDHNGKEWRNAEHVVEGWMRLGENKRLVRASSKQLAINGPYTVAFQEARP